MCGDATNRSHIKKLCGKDKADMVFTDPPYNASYCSRTYCGMMNDNVPEEEYVSFLDKANFNIFDYLKD